ncbi:MAG TPA: hypothetical protein VM282_00895 [Acidimicrobiales bacterium]|nr:hypothetical protein [Acidimicrobiales bacterium]
MSDPQANQGSFRVGAGRISSEELENAGVVPTDYQVTLDDDDAGECRWATKDEIRQIYVDNPVTASALQPDVWTLSIEHIDGESITFGYANGASLTTTLGAIDMNFGANATRYRKSGGIAYPADDGGNVIINASTAPRLVALRKWVHDELRQRAEERLQMAELVNQFAGIIAMNSGLDGIK